MAEVAEVGHIRIMVVDDHPLVRTGLEAIMLMFADLELVGCADGGMEAVRLCERLEPDVVLMDIVMPGMNGVDATAEIRRRCPSTHVVALTSFGDEELIQGVLRAGAFAGAAVTYAMYSTTFADYEKAHHIVRGATNSIIECKIFSTYIGATANLSQIHAVFIEAVLTAVLIIGLVAMIDPKNPMAPGANIAPIMIGLIVAVIGGTFGNLTGFALNPARDLGPKLFEAIAGWGHLGIPGPGGYMWVPIVGPFIGGFIGILLYDHFIARGLRRVNEPVLEAVGGVETDMADEPVTRVTT